MKSGNREFGDLFDPAAFPPELAWVPAHHRLHPDDPVYLLLAWHWRRVKQSEDTLAAAILELRTLLDSRMEIFSQGAEAIHGANDALAGIEAALAEKPAEFTAHFNRALAQPLERALKRIQALDKSLAPIARSFEVSQRRQLLASLLVGVALGVLATLIALFA